MLRSPSAPAPAGAALRVVDGGKGHLLTVRAVAASLGLSTATAYKVVAQGDLPHIRVSNVIRFESAELVAYLEQRRAAAG